MSKKIKSSLMPAAVAVVSLLSTQAGNAQTYRPPSVPLVTHDPYFSVWSPANKLNEAASQHWTGREQALSSLIRCDGKTYRLMGNTPTDVPVLSQTSVQVLPTRTIYTFAGAGVRVRMIFTSPLLPNDLDLMSRPVGYVTWEVVSTDGKQHKVGLYLDASAALAVNTPDQKVVWKREKNAGMTLLKIGNQSQPVLATSGDDRRIDWGYFYLSAGSQANTSFAIGDNSVLERSFASQGGLPSSDSNRQPRAVNDGDPVAAVAFTLGNVGKAAVTRHALLAYDDLYSIQFIGSNLRPYWRRNGADAHSLLKTAERDYASIQKRCADFDTELMKDMQKVGGLQYARLGALAYRQALAAQKLVADAKGQPLSFSKENFSNGCIATIDLIYPAGPQQIALSPSLLKASLTPIMLYATSKYWKFPFAPHDLGTYPKANGQVYGDGERGVNNQMPVEETGNLMLLFGALAKAEGNSKFSDPYWPILTKWANYLAQVGYDPENQLCTDDFAGHLAHNVNLSAKAIEALGAYAQLAKMRGDTVRAVKYRAIAQKMSKQWLAAAKQDSQSRLAFDRPGTWSQKYNLAWDSILGLNLFPQSFFDKEMKFYRTKINDYGLPLDSRESYTKLDWQIWTATLTGRRSDFDAMMTPINRWVSTTPERVPLTDWYDTRSARKSGFQARTAVGGVFMPLLKDKAIWTKWAKRDKQRPSGWAALPKRPVMREIVPTGSSKSGVIWKYTTNNPAGNWYASNFNDSSWSSGEAGFGSNGTPTIRVRTQWSTSDIWIRRTFQWNGGASKPQLYGFHDEGIEVYINGKRIGTAEGYNTSYDPLMSIPAGVLKPGKNVIAVHCHQTAGGQGVDLGIAQSSN